MIALLPFDIFLCVFLSTFHLVGVITVYKRQKLKVYDIIFTFMVRVNLWLDSVVKVRGQGPLLRFEPPCNSIYG